MAVDRAVGDRETGAVQPVDDRVAAEHAARHRREQPKDLELGNGQRDLDVAPERAPALQVEPQPTVRQVAPVLGVRCPRGRAAQDRHDPRHHLARRKRLHHIVVGAEFDAEHPVDLVVAARQK
jgi:hypothetical protein